MKGKWIGDEFHFDVYLIPNNVSDGTLMFDQATRIPFVSFAKPEPFDFDKQQMQRLMEKKNKPL